MIVAIEGMDGVGKTTIAKRIEKDLNYTYVKEPLKDLFEVDSKHILNISKKIFNTSNDRLIAWYLALGDIYALNNFKNQNVILDRHILLNYFWNGNLDTEQIFKTQIEMFGKPDLTILLVASIETRRKRILERNPNDPDLNNFNMWKYGYDKMIHFLEKYNYTYEVVNTDNLSIEETLNICKTLINQYEEEKVLQKDKVYTKKIYF